MSTDKIKFAAAAAYILRSDDPMIEHDRSKHKHMLARIAQKDGWRAGQDARLRPSNGDDFESPSPPEHYKKHQDKHWFAGYAAGYFSPQNACHPFGELQENGGKPWLFDVP